MDFQIKEDEDSIKKEDNNEVKPAKRPISLTLAILLGVSFLLFLLISIFASGTENFSVGVMMLPFIIFMPISLIISFIFIFINRQKNKKRTNGFIISSVASFILIILAIIFMTVFTNHLETANSLFENKKYEQAIIQYNAVIKENKILEDVAFSKDRIIEAQSFIDQASSFVAKGDSFYKNNQLEEALVEYNKGKEIYPYLKGLEKKIADIVVIEKKNKEGDSLFEKKKYEDALSKYGEILKINPTHNISQQKIKKINGILIEVNSLIRGGDGFYEYKLFDEAILEYNKAKEIYPYFKGLDKKISGTQKIITQAKSYMVKGDSYFQNNLFEKAIAQYNKALKIYPFLKGLDTKVSNTKSKIEVTAQSIAAQKEIEKINSTATELAEATTTTGKSASTTTMTTEATTPKYPDIIELTLDGSRSGSDILFSGITNLPDGVLITYEVTIPETLYEENYFVETGNLSIKDGKYSGEVNNFPVEKGKAEIWVSFQTILGTDIKQPQGVIDKYGELGEKMEGDNVVKSGYIKRIELIINR